MPDYATTTVPKTYLPMPLIQGYTEIRPLGRGGFGSVYLVSDETHRMLAMKVIMRREIDDYRYNREYESICTCGDLNHPDLIPILHVGKGEDFFYYTMRLADDAETGQKLSSKSTEQEIAAYKPKTLTSEIKANGGHMSIKAAIEAMLPVLSALEFLHAKNLLHRDVKPDNIVYLDGKPVLGDVGLVTEQTDDTMTMVASFGYTPEGGVKGVPGDLYSLGKTLHKAVGGDVSRPGLSVPTYVASSPDPLFQPLNKIILKSTRLRYASAEEMKTALEKILKQKRTRKTSSENKNHTVKHDESKVEHIPQTGDLSESKDGDIVTATETASAEAVTDPKNEDIAIASQAETDIENLRDAKGKDITQPFEIETYIETAIKSKDERPANSEATVCVESVIEPKSEDMAVVVESETSAEKSDKTEPSDKQLMSRKEILNYYADKRNNNVVELARENAIKLFCGTNKYHFFIEANNKEPMKWALLGFLWKIHRKMYKQGLLSMLYVIGIVLPVFGFFLLLTAYGVSGKELFIYIGVALVPLGKLLSVPDAEMKHTNAYKNFVEKKIQDIYVSSLTVGEAIQKIEKQGGTNFFASFVSIIVIVAIAFVCIRSGVKNVQKNTGLYISSDIEVDDETSSTNAWIQSYLKAEHERQNQTNKMPRNYSPSATKK